MLYPLWSRARAPVHAVRGGGSGTAVLTNQMACGGRYAQKRPGAEKREKCENCGISPNLVKFSSFCSFPRNDSKIPSKKHWLGQHPAPGAENDKIYTNFTKFHHFHLISPNFIKFLSFSSFCVFSPFPRSC